MPDPKSPTVTRCAPAFGGRTDNMASDSPAGLSIPVVEAEIMDEPTAQDRLDAGQVGPPDFSHVTGETGEAETVDAEVVGSSEPEHGQGDPADGLGDSDT